MAGGEDAGSSTYDNLDPRPIAAPLNRTKRASTPNHIRPMGRAS